MVAGRAARGTNCAYDLAGGNIVAFGYKNISKVAIAAYVALAVVGVFYVNVIAKV